MYIKNLGFLGFFALGLQLSFTQNVSIIRGFVLSDKNEPIAQAHVNCNHQKTISAFDGNFSLTLTQFKQVDCKCSHVGFMALDTIFTWDGKDIHLVLKTKEEKLLPIVIQTVDDKNITAFKNEISPSDLKDNIGQSLAQLLESVSGVSILRTGQNIFKPIIHGLHSQRVGVFVQGVSIEDHQWGYDHSPSIDLNTVDKINIIKGANALQYSGNYSGGMILMEQKLSFEEKPNHLHVFTESNGFGAGFALKKQWLNSNAWQIKLSLGAKKFGDRKTPQLVLNNTASQQIHAGVFAKKSTEKSSHQWRYAYYFNEIGIYSASHLGNVTDLFEVINGQRPAIEKPFSYNINRPKQMIHHHQVVYENKIFKPDNGFNLWTFGSQWNWRQEFDINRNPNENRSALNLSLLTQDMQWQAKRHLNDFKFLFGFQAQWQNNLANSPLGRRLFIPNYQKLEFGKFLIIEKPIREDLILEFGVRNQYNYLKAQKTFQKSRWLANGYQEIFSHFIKSSDDFNIVTQPTFHFHLFAFNIGLRKSFKNQLKIGLNGQYNERSPNVAELFSDGLHHSNAQIELGDLLLKKEKSSNVSFWLEKSWIKSKLQLNTYFNYMKDYVFLKPDAFETTLRGAFPVWIYKQTDAILTGLDYLFDFKLTKIWSVNHKMAYVYGHDRLLNQPLIDMPPFNSQFTIIYQKSSWKGSVSHSFFATQNRFPNFNFETQIINNQNELTPVFVDISTPPKGYHLFGLQLEKQLNLSKSYDSKVVLQINNMMNHSFRDYLNRQRFFAEELGRNILLQIQINY